jgi:hypothetical protein
LQGIHSTSFQLPFRKVFLECRQLHKKSESSFFSISKKRPANVLRNESRFFLRDVKMSLSAL